MVEGKTITVDVTTSEGISFSVETRLSEIPFAQLCATRHAFKNYRAFVNPGKESIKTIFHALPFQYFTNWIRKSSSFIPISKYFSVKCLKS